MALGVVVVGGTGGGGSGGETAVGGGARLGGGAVSTRGSIARGTSRHALKVVGGVSVCVRLSRTTTDTPPSPPYTYKPLLNLYDYYGCNSGREGATPCTKTALESWPPYAVHPPHLRLWF